MDLYDFKMNILLTITEIVIFAHLIPYILQFWVHFEALKTQNLTLPRVGGTKFVPPYYKKIDNFLCKFPTVLICLDFS